MELFFGPRARNNLKGLGGIQNVAITLSGNAFNVISLSANLNFCTESHTVEDFARTLQLSKHDLQNLKMIFMSVEHGDMGVLSAIGVKVENFTLLLLLMLKVCFW